jgi:hypothetical protein
MLVRVFIQGIEQRQAILRADAFPVQQRGCGLAGGDIATAQDFVQVESQQPLLVPLTPVDQQQLGMMGQDYPAGGLRSAEHRSGNDVFKGLG